MAVDGHGDLYIVNEEGGVSKVEGKTGALSAIADECGGGLNRVVVDGGNNLFMFDGIGRIRRVDANTGFIATIPWRPESDSGAG